MKSTKFPFVRYVIPREWFDNIINYNILNPLNNSQFISESKTKLKDFIDERTFVLIIYEIMNYIHSTFLYDFIIEAEINMNNNGIAFIKNVKVKRNNEFIEPKFGYSNSSFINNPYLKYPQFQFEFTDVKIKKEKDIEIISVSDKESISIMSNGKYIYNEKNRLFVLDSFPKKYLKPIGINNKSIYCYMISCFQVLLSIPELNYYFLYKKYKISSQKSLICDDFSDFISLYKYFQKIHRTKIDFPPSIYNICHSILPREVMNDCEEFLILFLKIIREELNIQIDDKINIEIGNSNEKIWENYRIKNYSFIDGLFAGLLRSKVICKECKKETYSYDTFMDLAIPIPKKNKSIITCLNQYFDEENLDNDYLCEKCNKRTSVSLLNNYFL